MNNEQVWFAVDVTLAPQAVEAIEFALSEAGASGDHEFRERRRKAV
jgi:hypothetical protein